jgi:nucleotide-binding universal stress UspA family protein
MSERDEELVARAMDFGGLYASQFTLLHVLQPAIALVSTGVEEMMDASEQTQEFALRRIHRLSDTIVAAGYRAHVEVETVPFAASEITDYAQRHNFDVVAISTRGRGGFKRSLLGSVADSVIRHTTMPVLVCRMADRS